MPMMPFMLMTWYGRMPMPGVPWSRWMSPVGRSMTSAGASGDDGDVKVYAPSATWTLMSRYGNSGRLRSAMVEEGSGRLGVGSGRPGSQVGLLQEPRGGLRDTKYKWTYPLAT